MNRKTSMEEAVLIAAWKSVGSMMLRLVLVALAAGIVLGAVGSTMAWLVVR